MGLYFNRRKAFRPTGPFDPNDVAGITFRIRGDDGITDISGNSVSITNNNTVSITSGVLNGHDVFDFVRASSQYLSGSASLFSTSDNVVFVVSKSDDSTGGVLICDRTTTTILTAQDFNSGAFIAYTDGAVGANNATKVGAVDQSYNYKTFEYSSGSKLLMRKDGSSVTITQTGSVAVQNGTAGWTVGERTDASVLWDGQIAEMIVYNQSVSSLNRGKIETYLADRYAL